MNDETTTTKTVSMGVLNELADWFNNLPDGGMGKEHFDGLVVLVSDMLARRPSSSQIEPVAVKPLEWRKGERTIIAESTIGDYFVNIVTNSWWREGVRGVWAAHSIEEAKAAAQADYETRIRSALSTSPVREAGEPAGYRYQIYAHSESIWHFTDDLYVAKKQSHPDGRYEPLYTRATPSPGGEYWAARVTSISRGMQS